MDPNTPSRPVPVRPRGPRAGFTLVELLVAVSVIALLIGVLLPALTGARRAAADAASSSNLRQLAVGVAAYQVDFGPELPQFRVDTATGEPAYGSSGDNIGALFGGKTGSLPGFPGANFGIDRIGAERRPLNTYVWEGPIPDDETDAARAFELPPFDDPADAGMPGSPLAAMGLDTSSMYELLGSSYTLNDHAPDEDPNDEPWWTLVPERGGRMPAVANPTRTWLIGTHPIYNFDDGGDRRMLWNGSGDGGVSANLAFVDGHVRAGLAVPPGPEHTTSEYTFLPEPGWIERLSAEETDP